MHYEEKQSRGKQRESSEEIVVQEDIAMFCSEKRKLSWHCWQYTVATLCAQSHSMHGARARDPLAIMTLLSNLSLLVNLNLKMTKRITHGMSTSLCFPLKELGVTIIAHVNGEVTGLRHRAHINILKWQDLDNLLKDL